MFQNSSLSSRARSLPKLFIAASMADPITIPVSKETATSGAVIAVFTPRDNSVPRTPKLATPRVPSGPGLISDFVACTKSTVPTVLATVGPAPSKTPIPNLVKPSGKPKKKSVVVTTLFLKFSLKSDDVQPQEDNPDKSTKFTGSSKT